eukprot:CAMPEP_0194265210 /NCGR_PEP_ID=MMETSP0169-20130528/535_1 /TAXON_ID=218684 /ORGANISM="Corethron pennatum, Strain L29A3" /LENGTH=155 /DNA_ID=CAMNT_0039005633 /DNA_START=126 /DNA_END=593 /DNA_ORIENTATION=+
MDSLPLLTTPVDSLRSGGPNSANFAASARRAHPVDTLQRAAAAPPAGLAYDASPLSIAAIDARATARGGMDLDATRRLYGSGLAMRLATERRHAASVGGRLPGFDSAPRSDAMLEAVTGMDVDIGFEDYLNLPGNRVTAPKLVLHGAMEVKLGLS